MGKLEKVGAWRSDRGAMNDDHHGRLGIWRGIREKHAKKGLERVTARKPRGRSSILPSIFYSWHRRVKLLPLSAPFFSARSTTYHRACAFLLGRVCFACTKNKHEDRHASLTRIGHILSPINTQGLRKSTRYEVAWISVRWMRNHARVRCSDSPAKRVSRIDRESNL